MRVWFLPAVLAGLSLAAAAGAEETGNAEAGLEVFDLCSGCHQVGKGAEHAIGPHLNMLFGRPIAGLEDYRYSKGMSRAGATGAEWHADTLEAFLANPRAIATNTRMSFDGIEDPQERTDLIAFLRQYSDDPANIPEADPTLAGRDRTLDPEILAIEGDREYGEYLSSECTTCHQRDGGDEGIPSIIYWPEQDFVAAMHAYKSQQRAHPVMQMIAGRLNDEEIAALAAYFATIE